MAVNWSDAPEVRRVAEWLIPQYHQHVESNAVEIRYRHRDDKPRSGDRDTLGGVAKIANLAAFEAGGAEDGDGEPFFVLWIPEHVWEMLDQQGQVGLVDALLCQIHSGKDDEGRVKLHKRKPDFDGFYANVERFGMWQSEAARMFEAMRTAGQLTLDLSECPARKKPAATVVGTGTLEPGDLPDRPDTLPLRLVPRDPEEAAAPAAEEAAPLQVVDGGQAAAPAENGQNGKPGRVRRSLKDFQRGQATHADDEPEDEEASLPPAA